MMTLVVIAAWWLLSLAALGALAWFLYQRGQRDRRRRPSPRHPVFRRRLPAIVREPGRELPKRFTRRVIKRMPAEHLDEIFASIVERNDLRASSTLDVHYQRLANEVVPDTAFDGEDPK